MRAPLSLTLTLHLIHPHSHGSQNHYIIVHSYRIDPRDPTRHGHVYNQWNVLGLFKSSCTDKLIQTHI